MSLNSVAKVLYKYKDTTLDVTGDTDSVSKGDHNRNLSFHRAYSVADYLQAQGIPANRLAPYGLGESQPIANNNTEAGRSQNRRVELFITVVEPG